MPTAATLRRQIEKDLELRFPSALTPAPRTIRETATCGIDAVDQLLEGGLPVGAITEIVGAASSGRTSLALSFLAQRTAEGRVCAWVDVHDVLDPESAAASGVALKQLLWVRCRDEVQRKKGEKPWTRLDQALRATDLLLQAGGFAAMVLDLGETAPEHAYRIPLATWFRFRQAADRTRCCLLILGQAPFAQSSAALALECAQVQPDSVGGTVLRGYTYAVSSGRLRFAAGHAGARKPPVSSWSSSASWNSEKRA
jgi:hypothetical protein